MMPKREHCWGCGSSGGIGLQGQGGARPWEWYRGLGGPVGTVWLGWWQVRQAGESFWSFWQRGQLWRRARGAGAAGGGNGGGAREARRLPQSGRGPTSTSRQLETLAGEGRHRGTEAGMQGSERHLEASPRSGGPGGGLQDCPKDWCITAIDATARATLLTYAIANRQDTCRRGIKKGQCPDPLPPNPLLTVLNTPTPYFWTPGLK